MVCTYMESLINNLPLKDISLASPDNFHTPFIFTAKMGDVSLKLTGAHCI